MNQQFHFSGSLLFLNNSNVGEDCYSQDVVSYSDYYPYGALLPNRHGSAGDQYEYGFNGMRKDDEIKNQAGTSYDFGARMYDPRVGRWLTIDPLTKKQPAQSPYKAFYNSPIIFNDPDGKDEFYTVVIVNKLTGKTHIIEKPTAISTKIMTNGSDNHYYKRAASTSYYDFTTIETITIDKNGKETSKLSYEILFDSGVKDIDMVAGSGWKQKFNTKSKADWHFNVSLDGNGGRQRGGIYGTSKEGGASPTKQRSLTAAEETKMDELLEGLGALKGGSLGNRRPDQIGDLSNLIEKTNDVIEDQKGGGSSSDEIPGNNKTLSNKIYPDPTRGKGATERHPATPNERMNGDTLNGKPDIIMPKPKGENKGD